MPNVGYGVLPIIPSMRGVQDMIRRELMAIAGPVGSRAGTVLGENLVRDARGRLHDSRGHFVREMTQIGDAAGSAAGDAAGEAAGEGLKSKLKAGAVVAGVAAGAVLVAGITKAMEQANISGTLQAQLGTSNKVAAEQGKLAGKLYSTGVSGSFQDAADAIKSVMQSGLAPPGTTTKQLEQIATKASDVATVFEQDLGGVTNAVSQMLRTGLVDSADEAFDVLTKGFQSGANKADDLLDTFNEYSTQFRKAGLDGATAMGLLNQAVGAGARDADIAADAIKEFSIRAVDGSKTSADGFKLLGLSADDMAKKFGKGGDSARHTLDATLDRLAKIQDPIKRNAAAVALFGTQAEDLGAALFAMDPSAAAKGLGKVGGAAQTMGATIRSGPAHELEVFKRQLEQGFVEFLGGKVLPILTEVGIFLNTRVRPPLVAVAAVVAAVLVPALVGLWKAGDAVVGFLKDFGVWLVPLGIAIVGVTIAVNAQAIAMGLLTAVMTVYSTLARGIAAVTRIWAGAQALLNAVMNANPIILIVTAIVALGVALVIAYKKSETFRRIVQGAWEGIQTAALWAWNTVLKPVFDALRIAVEAVGKVFSWLWMNILSPVVGFITKALKVLFVIWVVVTFGPIIVAIKLLAAVVTWLWKTIIWPAVKGIAALFTWLWKNVISPTITLMIAGFKVWWAVLKFIFGLVRTYILGPMASAFTWLWKNAIKPAFDGIVTVVKGAWKYGIKPIFDLLKRGVGAVRDSFKTAVDGIGKLWKSLESKTRGPAQFVVDVIYNNGIRSVWNTVAGLVGLKKLGKVTLGGGSGKSSGIDYSGKPQVLARGGVAVMPGYTPGRDVHSFYSPTGGRLELSGGEAVMRPEFTRALGVGGVNTLNAAARSGGIGGVRRALGFADGGVLHFDKGGIVGDIFGGLTDVAKKVGGTLMSGFDFIANPGRMWDKATGFIRDKLKSIGQTQWAQALGRVPVKILGALKDRIVKAASGLFGSWGGGSAGVGRGLAFAKAQRGKPYLWGGVGPNGYDCSGFMSAIQGVIDGQSPYRRRWATMSFQGGAPAGWKRGLPAPFRVGITHSGVGHTAGTLMGVNVESRGGQGVVVGSAARGYNNRLFQSWYGYAPSMRGATTYDTGGRVPQGLTAVYNGTRRPEALLTDRQWQSIYQAARGGEGGVSYNIYPRASVLDRRELERITQHREMELRVGRQS